MRSAVRSTACRGSMLALAVASAQLLTTTSVHAQTTDRIPHRGAILVQTVDTAINPLAAEIVLPAFGLSVRLSDEGAVILVNIPDGTYLVQARHLGYRPDWRFVRIAGDTAQLEFILPPADPASAHRYGLVESRLRAFLRRTLLVGEASFITRAEIERRRPANLAALLKRVSQITVERGPGRTRVRSNRVPQPHCRSGMLLLVDGMLPVTPPPSTPEPIVERRSRRGVWADRAAFRAGSGRGDQRSPSAGTSRDLVGVGPTVSSGLTEGGQTASPLDWLPISLVAGVEIYPTIGDVPPEFRVAGAECGAVLVWTVTR